MQTESPLSNISYNRPHVFYIRVHRFQLRPLNEKHISYEPHHSSRQRYSFDVGDAVNPDDFGAKHFADKAGNTADRCAGADNNIRPFPQDITKASYKHF